jgi:trans-2-enoyl-CoA reductase
MSAYRVFLAHPKGLSGEEVARMEGAVRAYMKAKQPTLDIEVTTGFADWERHFKRLGSWDAWILDVAKGVDYTTREPRYTHFVVPEGAMGKATADILSTAMAVGKEVLIWNGASLRLASSVRKVGEDFRTGWRID